MVSEAPPFWWTEPDWRARALYPFSWVYGQVARSRMEKGRRTRVAAPVLCVGNFTVGGAGKTPTVIALAGAAKAAGMAPGILSRGYGGTLEAPTLVDLHHHRAKDVGDEPLLLAEAAPTVVARDRFKGAAMLIDRGADIIIMDDGFQSATLGYDYALLVIDARRGLGNGHIIPGGPVRAPVIDQLRHASALLTVGAGDAAAPIVRAAARAAKPVYEAKLVARAPDDFKGLRVLAYAGIADPGKFFATLASTGADIVETRRFGDHHDFSEEETGRLLAEAERHGLVLVSTAKDVARLRGGHGNAATLGARTRVLDVDLTFDLPAVPRSILDKTVQAFKTKRLTATAYRASSAATGPAAHRRACRPRTMP